MSSVYSVSQINSYIKNMFTQDYLLSRVSVKGEVSNCKYHTSGHIYFTLKDEHAAISCVMFAGYRRGLSFRLENGQKVVASGAVSVFERSGSYQLYASEIRRDGLGELYVRYEALKRELEEMGMFDERYKQPIPSFVRTLGVVTASTGAAVRDIIQISRRRNPGIRILLYPAQVQGEGAAQSIVRGISVLAGQRPDVIIIGRGGGSIEDLWAFNEEIVARAVFECPVPVISAVGHETDTVITDYVADLRAPTPSAAAELAVADVRELLGTLQQYGDRIDQLMNRQIEAKRARVNEYALNLQLCSPAAQTRQLRMQLERRQILMRELMHRRLLSQRSKVQILEEKLRGLSPYEKLSSGYAVVLAPAQDEQKKRIVRADEVQRGDVVEVYFEDGSFTAEVL